MKNIIFIAPPAAGKGTQSERIEKKYGYTHISTGDLLRQEIKTGSELGREIDALISSGKFVSDDLITEILTKKLSTLEGNFILDGYPRNINQAKRLDEILKSLNIEDVVAIYLELPESVATERALGRLICSSCGSSYHRSIEELLPKQEGICDSCGSELIQRADDNEETFKTRFATYLNETEPLLTYYKEKDMLKIVDSNTNTNAVFESIEQILTGERSNG